jgi:hypothetical protein
MKAAFLRMALLLVTGITSVQVVNAESLRQAEVRAIGGYVGFLMMAALLITGRLVGRFVTFSRGAWR